MAAFEECVRFAGAPFPIDLSSSFSQMECVQKCHGVECVNRLTIHTCHVNNFLAATTWLLKQPFQLQRLRKGCICAACASNKGIYGRKFRKRVSGQCALLQTVHRCCPCCFFKGRERVCFVVRPFAKLMLSYKNAGLCFARFADRGLRHYGGQVIN